LNDATPGTTPLDCRLLCSSSSEHLEQIYAGFGILARRGLAKVAASKATTYAPGVWSTPKLEVWLNGTLKLIYDTHDSSRFLEEDLATCDLYFKRSYEPNAVSAHAHRHKILPLGLSYLVYGPGDFGLRRAMWSLLSCRKDEMRSVLVQFLRSSLILSRMFDASNGRSTCQVKNFEGVPDLTQPPRVLLLTQTWEPGAVVQNAAQLQEERHRINQMRAECIRKLRQQHGRLFTGGFSRSRHALEHFPDCVVDDARLTRKRAYLRLVHQSDICVTSLGLHGSNGWKLSEYAAAARAIVAERPRHRAPGNFEAGQNYLEFTTPDECVAATVALVESPARRLAMMRRNFEYYHAHLRPDALVWNTLQTAVQRL
jgi:hypothetical protein